MKLTPKQAWRKRLKLRAEGNKLRAEGNKLWAEGDKLRAEGDKLYAEGNKLYAAGDIVFLTAVITTYGNIELAWLDGGCKLANGVEFKNK